MTGAEFKALYQLADTRRKQAEATAAAINRGEDLKGYHSYAGLVSLLADPQMLAFNALADWEPVPDEKYAAVLDSVSKELETAVASWAVAPEVNPVTPDLELPPDHPPLISADPGARTVAKDLLAKAGRTSPWVWVAVGAVALGGALWWGLSGK